MKDPKGKHNTNHISVKIKALAQGNFFNCRTGLKMVNLWVIFMILVGIPQNGKVLPKPTLGFIKPNITPRM